MKIKNRFTNDLTIDFPMIMAPMFLVSNLDMCLEAMRGGIAGTFPSLNFREAGQLEEILAKLNEAKNAPGNTGTYGVNLIVQKSNPLYAKHLKMCVDAKVPFYITSLGSPEEVIKEAHKYGGKVYCDVTNLEHAQKCYDLGADGFIAVGQGAGGHAGPFPLMLLVPTLKKHFPDMPVISAGGVATGDGIAAMLTLGADGVSMGTRFIASTEGGVNNEYKDAVVDSKMADIVMTERLSGTPCTIINTPYAKKIGYKQNAFERYFSKNKRTKKYFKMFFALKGMRSLEKSVKPGNYNNLWCAGQTVELIDEIKPCYDIVTELKDQTYTAIERLQGITVQSGELV